MQQENIKVPAPQPIGGDSTFAEDSHPGTQVFDRIHSKFFTDRDYQMKCLSKGRKYRIEVNNDQSNVNYYLQLLTVSANVHPKQIVSKEQEPNGLTDVSFTITDKDLQAVSAGKAKLWDLYQDGKLKIKGDGQFEERQQLDDLDEILNV